MNRPKIRPRFNIKVLKMYLKSFVIMILCSSTALSKSHSITIDHSNLKVESIKKLKAPVLIQSGMLQGCYVSDLMMCQWEGSERSLQLTKTSEQDGQKYPPTKKPIAQPYERHIFQDLREHGILQECVDGEEPYCPFSTVLKLILNSNWLNEGLDKPSDESSLQGIRSRLDPNATISSGSDLLKLLENRFEAFKDCKIIDGIFICPSRATKIILTIARLEQILREKLQ